MYIAKNSNPPGNTTLRLNHSHIARETHNSVLSTDYIYGWNLGSLKRFL